MQQQIPTQLTVIKLCNKVIPQVAFNIIFHSQSLLVLFCSRRRSRYGKDGDVCKQDPAKVSNFFWGRLSPAGWLLTDTHSPLLSDFAQTLSDLVKQSERGNPDDFVSFHFSIFSEVVNVYCTWKNTQKITHKNLKNANIIWSLVMHVKSVTTAPKIHPMIVTYQHRHNSNHSRKVENPVVANQVSRQGLKKKNGMVYLAKVCLTDVGRENRWRGQKSRQIERTACCPWSPWKKIIQTNTKKFIQQTFDWNTLKIRRDGLLTLQSMNFQEKRHHRCNVQGDPSDCVF